MWRTFLVAVALSFQIAAYPERESTKGHGCWATNGERHEECSFPFEYEGTLHNKCQPYGSSYWCATTSSYTDNPSKWGYCYQCNRQKYWDYQGGSQQSAESQEEEPQAEEFIDQSEGTEAAVPSPSPEPECEESALTECQTCTSMRAFGKSCLQRWKYNYIWYTGCDRNVVTNGKPWCYTTETNDWGYCNPDTCESDVSVGAMVTTTPSDSTNDLANGVQDTKCVGGSLLFNPRPCGRDCTTLANSSLPLSKIDAQANCDTSAGCACPDGKYWEENQSRCVSRQTCQETNVYQIKRPCGLTGEGLYRCQYPFTYQGTEYNACATYKGRLWCSLDQGAYENHRRWGYCEGLIGRDENKCPVAPAP